MAYNDYELLAKRLGSELKAQPMDRLRSEEELVVQEAQRLERLETERLQRMQPEGTVQTGKTEPVVLLFSFPWHARLSLSFLAHVLL